MKPDWDPAKAAANLKKHGVTFSQAALVFGDEFAQLKLDPAHADRIQIIGLARNRLLLVVFIELEDDVARIITARPATPHERKDYEETRF